MEEKEIKSRRGNPWPALFAISSVIAVIALTLTVLLARSISAEKKEPIRRSVSMGEEAAAKAYLWLSQIEDMPLSYEEIREMMGDIRLELVLTPTGETGIYRQTLAEGSFEDCRNLAQSGLERAYREVAGYRFLEAGYTDEIADEMLDDLMREAYGVSVAEYLTGCGVELLPSLEELAERYSGEVEDE